MDDDLTIFAADGAPPLPTADAEGHLAHDGALLWHASYGTGPTAVVLLHGGLGHAGNWGHQLPALRAAGHRVILMDARGHGRSTRDARPYTYERMAGDLLAVLDAQGVARPALVGWSDGACVSLILARQAPERVAGVFFFACNMDPSGTRPIDESDPVLGRCFARHARDYAERSATPDAFEAFVAAVGEMQRTQPDWTARELGEVRVPVVIAQSPHDEFITPEHAEHLARSIPGATLHWLDEGTHFAPLQRPAAFDAVLGAFVRRVL